MTRRKKRQDMNPAELDKAAAAFDREFIADTFGEPGPEARKRWNRAKRKRGRPARGEGAARVSVTVEKSVLLRVDAFATRTGQTRFQLIERGLLEVLAES